MRVWWLTLVFGVLSGCAALARLVDPPEPPETKVFRLTESACGGYELEVSKDGVVGYRAHGLAREKGPKTVGLALADVQRLVDWPVEGLAPASELEQKLMRERCGDAKFGLFVSTYRKWTWHSACVSGEQAKALEAKLLRALGAERWAELTAPCQLF